MSSPIFVTIILILPSVIIVPPIILSSIFLLTGKLSPVIIDSSIKQLPSIMIPSVGILSPLFTINVSLIEILSKSIFFILPLISILAVLAWISDKSPIAVVVFCTERCSRTLPSSTKVIIVAAVSKNK